VGVHRHILRVFLDSRDFRDLTGAAPTSGDHALPLDLVCISVPSVGFLFFSLLTKLVALGDPRPPSWPLHAFVLGHGFPSSVWHCERLRVVWDCDCDWESRKGLSIDISKF